MSPQAEALLDAFVESVRHSVHANITANMCGARSDHRKADKAMADAARAREALVECIDALERRAEKAEARRDFLDEAAVMEAVRAFNGRGMP
jgi:hypothetical protein